MNLKVVDLVEASEISGIPVESLRRYVNLGLIPGRIRIGSKHFLNLNALQRFLSGKNQVADNEAAA